MTTHDKGRTVIEKHANRLGTLRIEYVPIDSVEPNDYNPNRQSAHDFELLCRSIEEDGFTQPIIVLLALNDRGKNPIVDGEHRWRAARTLTQKFRDSGGAEGVLFEEIPVAKVDMTMAQAKIATLRHNRARGSEDVELSAQVLRDLQELGALDWAADSLMMSDVEINRLLEEIPASEALAAEQFSEAWVPERAGSEDGMKDFTSFAAKEEHGKTQSLTPLAADRMREAEERVRNAKTQQERDTARRDQAIYRVIAIFTDEEAAVVKKVLGERAAPMILQLCRDYDARTANGQA